MPQLTEHSVRRPRQLQASVVDAEPIFRLGIRSALQELYPGVLVHEGGPDNLLGMLESYPRSGLLLFDLDDRSRIGMVALPYLKKRFPRVALLPISRLIDKSTVERAFHFGASAVIPRESDVLTLRGTIASVLEGRTNRDSAPLSCKLNKFDELQARRIQSLSPQQFRVFELICRGLMNKQIAGLLELTEATVKTHASAVLRKLGVNNRTQASLLLGALRGETVRP